MCKWGTLALVNCPAGFSGENKERQVVPVDACIAPLVRALNNGGILTVASCCGHGNGPGRITLQDGRELAIYGTAVPRPKAQHRFPEGMIGGICQRCGVSMARARSQDCLPEGWT